MIIQSWNQCAFINATSGAPLRDFRYLSHSPRENPLPLYESRHPCREVVYQEAAAAVAKAALNAILNAILSRIALL